MTTRCPKLNELRAFVDGELAAERSQEIDAHLNTCESCRIQIGEEAKNGPATTTPPSVPDGYEFLDEIGRGGIGVVYRVRRADGAIVAIKTLLPEHRDDPMMASHLEHEAKMSAQIRHLRVLCGSMIKSFSATDSTPYIEFPWVPGTTLAKKLDTPISPKNLVPRIRWLIQCCKAVEAAHRQSPAILHLDLKPENVLIYDRDSEAVLIDFGLAREWPTNDGTIPRGCGTPAYMAPELANGVAYLIGPRTDVFSLGGILCTILTGQPPYSASEFAQQGGVRQAAREAKLAYAFQWLDACHAHSPFAAFAAFAAFAKKCLSPDVSSRPADAGVVANELEKFLTSRGGLRPAHRKTVTIAASMLALVVVIVALALLVLKADAVPPPKEQLLTVSKWVRFIHSIKPLGHHECATAIGHFDVGAYPLVRIHRPELIERITLSHDARVTRPWPHMSDYTPKLAKLPPATVNVDLRDNLPSSLAGVAGDRLFKHLLKAEVAMSNKEWLDPRFTVIGGVGVAVSEVFQGPIGRPISLPRGTGGGSRAFLAADQCQREWNAATCVTLHVKLRGMGELLKWDITPTKIGWENGIRDGELD